MVGITFKEWRSRLANVSDLELMISGAPLGEELTLFEDYDGYGLNLMISNPAERVRATLWSLKEEVKWNPRGDNLIHCTAFVASVEFCPHYDRFHRAGNYEFAYKIYNITKKFFEAFNDDLVCGDSEEFQNAFEWRRNHNVQKVITFFEENRRPTADELSSDSWSQWWPTENVFPNLGTLPTSIGQGSSE
jgi:hypothetical protein